MGIPSGGSVDIAARKASGSLSSVTAGASIQMTGAFNLALSGTFVATLSQERSFDGGTTWISVTFANGSPVTFTAPVSVQWYEPQAGVLHRVKCSAYTSGVINWRLSQ